LIFNRAAGTDLYPFLKERLFEPLGMEKIWWHKLGGDGELGPFDQGFSGINTTAREHARFLYLALHRGKWKDKRIVPENYYDFALQATKVKPQYGGLWWVHRYPDLPQDLFQTSGFRWNEGVVVPSLDLVFVRVGDGLRSPKDFDHELVKRVLAAMVQEGTP
jgi:CubicO group peptidase (beta-lactamase class C family)